MTRLTFGCVVPILQRMPAQKCVPSWIAFEDEGDKEPLAPVAENVVTVVNMEWTVTVCDDPLGALGVVPTNIVVVSVPAPAPVQ